MSDTKASAGKKRRILIIIENLPAPFDRRVWMEATTLRDAGYQISIICPTGRGYDLRYEMVDDIAIYRYKLPLEANRAKEYILEYSAAIALQFWLTLKVFFGPGFDVIQACNPPDNIFLIGAFYKLFGKRFVFDHHDVSPELYIAKFGKKDLLYKLMVLLERLTFLFSDISIATNNSYKKIAIERGKMDPEKVFVVRSGPSLSRMKIMPPVDKIREGKKYLVGYVGVMGVQDGLDYLLRSAMHIIQIKKRTDIHFALVGSGTELDMLKTFAKENKIDEFVTFTGRIPDKEMLEVLNTADVCVNPDVANDMNDLSTMNKVMEYMALGKPMVQFDLTESRFSAQDASLYAKKNDVIDMAEKILYLLANPELCKKMGQFGIDRVTNELEWKYEAPKLLGAYDSLWSNR